MIGPAWYEKRHGAIEKDEVIGMANHESRIKRPPLQPRSHLRTKDTVESQLAGERHILELIALGAPLPGIFKRLCTALDVQIGNVISLVLLTGERAKHLYSFTQTALQMNLMVFSSSAILSRERALLGTLEIYGCEPRRPTLQENQLIKRAICLAEIALQRHADEHDFKRPTWRERWELDGAPEKPLFIN
jgi:hypothetical protein